MSRFDVPEGVWKQLFRMVIILGKEQGSCVVKRMEEEGGDYA